MLNWIWLGLIVIAIAVATGRDISELSQDRFRNDKAIPLTIISSKQISPDHYSSDVIILKSQLKNFYDPSDIHSLSSDTVHLAIEYSGNNAASFSLPADAAGIWQDMASAQGDEKRMSGKITDREAGTLLFTPEPVKFRILAKVANDGLLKSAETAVTISLGLIGVMALWLGIMKIA
jgi:spore maturation protein A